MTHARVAVVTLILAGCAASQPSKPPAPVSSAAEAPRAAPAPQPAPAPAAPLPPRVTTPTPPAAPSPPPAPAPAPAPRVLYVKTHMANFREGAGTNMRIRRVLRRGARLEVLEERQEWFLVRLDDGQEGWVAASVTSATAP
jgi:uncharacterized protein YgiM (DUF1202 family)